jgi:hypothetical protein
MASACHLMNGLLPRVCKHACTMRSEEGLAPAYVNIVHRTRLKDAFAGLVLQEWVPSFPVGLTATLWVSAITLFYFASALAIYMLHGGLKDGDNRLRQPHRLVS